MRVDVYADIACPWCRLCTHRFHQAVTADHAVHDVELVHRPYQLDPDAPGEARPLLDVVTETFGSQQAAAMAAEITQLGASEDVEYRLDRALSVNTFTAHRLLWFALREVDANRQAELATALYDAHFRDGKNIADHDELAEVAGHVGLDPSDVTRFLATTEGTAEVTERLAAAQRDGVTVVPTFVFPDGEVVAGAVSSDALLETLDRTKGRGR